MIKLTHLNDMLTKIMPVITPISLLFGVIFASFFNNLHYLVPWLFAFLTFSGSLGSNFKNIKKAMLTPSSLILILFLLYVWLPLTAYAVGNLFFGSNQQIVTGMVLEFAVPTAVVSLIWVTIYKGNTALSLSVLIIDTLLSPVITPITLKILLGSNVKINPMDMVLDLILMIALPALFAMSLNQFSKGKIKIKLSPKLAPFSKVCLMVVVMINSSRAAPFFTTLDLKLLAVGMMMLVLAWFGFVSGIIGARILKQKRDVSVSIAFGSGMRNISAGAVIAAQYFPPEVLFPVMICTVFQQVLAAVTGLILSKLNFR